MRNGSSTKPALANDLIAIEGNLRRVSEEGVGRFGDRKVDQLVSQRDRLVSALCSSEVESPKQLLDLIVALGRLQKAEGGNLCIDDLGNELVDAIVAGAANVLDKREASNVFTRQSRSATPKHSGSRARG